MSTIPPNWLGSIIQTQGAKARAAEEKQKADAAEAASEASFANKLQDVIASDDRDAQVYSDAEGAGSQGSPSEEDQEEQQQTDPENQDDHPASGLDLQA